MLKRFSELLPAVTAAALIVTALFNIGFFNSVGIHFLGVVDLSNVVYTFGLAFGLILSVAILVGQSALEAHGKHNPDFVKQFSQFTTVSLIVKIALIVAVILPLIPQFREHMAPYASIVGYYLSIFFITALMCANRAYLAYRAEKKMLVGEVASSLGFTVVTVFLAGAYIAHQNIFELTTYTVTTKNGTTLNQARLVRSSSSGFLVATDGAIRFLPSGEITEIKANRPVAR
jgi:hypothetical protein